MRLSHFAVSHVQNRYLCMPEKIFDAGASAGAEMHSIHAFGELCLVDLVIWARFSLGLNSQLSCTWRSSVNTSAMDLCA